MKKWIWGSIGGLIVLIVVGIGGWWLYDHFHYQQLVDQPADVKKWEADPRPLQSEQTAVKRIKEIPQSAQLGNRIAKGTKLVVIPGLRGAWSINAKTKRAGFGTNWVPQGVTQSKDSLFVSLYDGDHKLNSLILEINKKTGRYRKSFILKSKAHVGGITYDREKKRLLWSDDNSKLGGAGISYASQRALDAYQAQVEKAPLESTRIPLHLANRTSAITLYDHQLVFVKYGKNAINRSLIALPVNDDNLPAAITEAQFNRLIRDLIPQLEGKNDTQSFQIISKKLMDDKIINSVNAGWDRIQGIAIAKTGLTFVSQSNGAKPGKIWIRIPLDKSWSKLTFATPKSGDKIINVPNSVEEISLNADDSQLALIFESGAKAYREEGSFWKRPHYMDRIMLLPISVQSNTKK